MNEPADQRGLPPPLPPAGPPPLPAEVQVTPPPLPGMCTAPPPPRVWTALAVGIGAIPASGLVSGLILAGVLLAGGVSTELLDRDGLAAVLSHPDMLLALFLPSQCVFLLAALCAAKLSPRPPLQRLGYVRSRMPWPHVALFAAAAPLCGFVGGEIMTLVFGKPGEQMQLLNDVIAGQTGTMAVLVATFLAVVPAFVEETLFRGYVLRRLLERWHPAAAIGVSALIFASAHLDPTHIVAVLPMGVWFGVVAWRCGSTWPAMLCHAVQNLVGVAGMMGGEPGGDGGGGETPWGDPVFLAILGYFVAAFVLSLVVMARRRPA